MSFLPLSGSQFSQIVQSEVVFPKISPHQLQKSLSVGSNGSISVIKKSEDTLARRVCSLSSCALSNMMPEGKRRIEKLSFFLNRTNAFFFIFLCDFASLVPLRFIFYSVSRSQIKPLSKSFSPIFYTDHFKHPQVPTHEVCWF